MAAAATIAHDPERELSELREYLGDEYDEDKLRRYEQTVVDEFREVGDEQDFYRTSQGYLYDLTAFAASGTKLPYLRALTGAVPAPARLLDYGCGIGSDGLLLLEAGYDVEFADFDNPSVAYLRWRLERRGLEAPIHDIDADRVPGGFDAAYSFDVIEHVGDPAAFMGELERRARLVAVNLLEEEEDDLPIHHPLPIADLRRRAARGRVVHYGRYHDRRSHLLLFRPPPASPVDRLRSWAEIARGTLARRVDGA